MHVGSSHCGQVIANDSVLRSSTVDATSAEALPELVIPQLSSSGLNTRASILKCQTPTVDVHQSSATAAGY